MHLFRCKNAVPDFQTVINHIIFDNKCEGTFAYLDDTTVCGKTKKSMTRIQNFLKAASDCNLTLNIHKCLFATKELKLLRYYVSNEVILPDPEQVKPITNLANRTNKKSYNK